MSIKHALSVRSDHAIGESIMQVDTVVTRAKELGFETVALVDTMSVSSLVALSSKCKKEGIRALVGCTLRVCDDPTYRKALRRFRDDQRLYLSRAHLWRYQGLSAHERKMAA